MPDPRGRSVVKIEAMIRPFKFAEVQKELLDTGVGGIAVTDVRGCGSQADADFLYRGSGSSIGFAPKIQIEVVVGRSELTEVIEAIRRSARTGKVGDGMIFVLEMTEATRIRTGGSGGILLRVSEEYARANQATVPSRKKTRRHCNSSPTRDTSWPAAQTAITRWDHRSHAVQSIPSRRRNRHLR